MLVNKTAVIATMLVAGLAGCTTSRPDDPGSSAGSEGSVAAADCPAFIEVTYDSGMPAVDPDECAVAPNADVMWRGPSGSPTVFAIKFKSATPTWAGERMETMSTGVGGYQKVTIRMPANPGTYRYAISANGEVLDPAIIIRPR